jgi:hypothetical protein
MSAGWKVLDIQNNSLTIDLSEKVYGDYNNLIFKLFNATDSTEDI